MFFYIFSILFFSFFYTIDCSEGCASVNFNDDRGTPRKKIEVEVNLAADCDEKFSILDQFFEKPFFVEKIYYKSDINLSTAELKYLTDFEENSWILLQDLKRACWHLKRKNKFDSVILSLEEFNAAGRDPSKQLTVLLKSNWTFSKIKIKGSLANKERYQQFYLLENGVSFELTKHQKSIEKILNELKKEGYLNIKIQDHFDYDNNTKQVSVILNLTNTERFKIDNITVNIRQQENVNSNIMFELKSDLEIKLSNILKDTYFSMSQIEEQLLILKKYLVHKGYLHPTIICKTQIQNKTRQVNLFFDVTFFQNKSFIFQGNSFFTSEQLLEELLVIDTSLLIIPPSLLVEDLINLYKDKGFWDVLVHWKEDSDKYVFTIKEGSRVKISNIYLKDQNDDLPQKEIQEFFREFIKLDYFDAETLKACINKLTAKYMQNGFWDFSVIKHDYILQPGTHTDNRKYDLVLYVMKGKQKILSSIKIEGYPELINNIIFSKWNQKPFDISIVQEQKQWLLKHFKSAGYSDLIIKPELIEQGCAPQDNGTNQVGVILKWIISKSNNVTRFGKTIVNGCSRIDNKVILRELAYKEGALYEKSKIDETVKRLKSLNMFESVSAVPCNLDNSKETKAIMLSIIEDDPFEIRVRFGVAQISKTFTNLPTATYKIGGSFLWKNPFNLADILRFDADLSRFSRNFSIAYEIPWIFNQPIHTLIRGYAFEVGQPLMGGSNKKIFNENHEGFSFSFNRNYFNYQFTLKMGLDLIKVSDISPQLAQVIQYEPWLLDRRIPYLLFEPLFILDRLDNALDPTIGTYTLISAKGFFPVDINQASFIKLNFEQSFVHPMHASIIGAVRLRAGYIFNANFDSIIPTERFYLGGPNTIRAYEPNMVPPLNCFKCDQEGTTSECWVPVGGKSMLNINSEIRFPIYKKLSGVFFNDAGFLVADKISQISAKDLFGATGFGLRYATPCGPIRFDIGFKWKKRTGDDKPYAFYLTLGQAF